MAANGRKAVTKAYAMSVCVDTICWHGYGQHHFHVEKVLCQFCLDADCFAVVPGLLAEGYANRYRNSWTAAVAATKTLVEEVSRRRGRPPAGAPRVSISMADLPVPVPLSRFQWPSVSFVVISIQTHASQG